MPYFKRAQLEAVTGPLASGAPIPGLPSRGGVGESLGGVREDFVEPVAEAPHIVELADAVLAAARPDRGEPSQGLARPRLVTPAEGVGIPDGSTLDVPSVPKLPASIPDLGEAEDESEAGTLESVPESNPASGATDSGQELDSFFDGPVPVLEAPGPVMPGASARSVLSLINEDDATARIVFVSTALIGAGSGAIPAECVSFNPNVLILEPGEEGDVAVCVAVPASTGTGSYSGLIRATPLDHLKAVLVVRVETR